MRAAGVCQQGPTSRSSTLLPTQPTRRPLVKVTPDGTVMVSTNGETGWQQAGTLDGQVEALDAAPKRWHAATATGVYESTDDGTTWTLVLDPSH